MKKLLVLVMSLMMVLSMTVPVMAAEKSYVIDDGDKITLASETELNGQAKDFADKTGVDLVYMDTTGSQLPSEIIESIRGDYAEDAVIMVHNIDNNKVATKAFGKAGKILDEAALDELFKVYDAADTYKKGAADYFALAEKKLVATGEFKDSEGSDDFTDLAPEVTEPVNETEATEPQVVPDHRLKERLVDDADLLTKDQEERILEQLDAISKAKEMDVVIYTTDSFDQPTVVDAADDYFAYNGFGVGEDREGILMFVCMNTRDLYFATHGPNTISKFTDNTISKMVGEVGPYLTQEQYGEACEKYIELVDYNTEDHYNFIALIGAIIAFFIGGISVGSAKVAGHRRQLKSVRYKSEANNYVRPGSYNLTNNSVRYVTTDVTRVYDPLPKDSGSGGGGSTTHMHSSGSSFGGGGGKF